MSITEPLTRKDYCHCRSCMEARERLAQRPGERALTLLIEWAEANAAYDTQKVCAIEGKMLALVRDVVG